MKTKRLLSALAGMALVYLACPAMGMATALDDYVATADPNYGYRHYYTRRGEGYTTYFFAMTSQQWRTPDEVDRVFWEHELLIAVPWIPFSGNPHTALLVVNGGSNDGEFTTDNNELIGWLAVLTGSVTAMVNQIPNQPLSFADEGGRARGEDELLAYGMDKYLDTGDPEWLVQLPMTKAVVRAMDTVQAFAANPQVDWPRPPRIDDFIVLGGSKRGWAAWLTAAVEAPKGGEPRVKAIVPASIDLLNLDEQFVHHWEAYGSYADAIEDYVAFDLPCRSKTPAGRAMLEIIDPYEYRERLTLPKLLVNSAGDQFFVPDSSQFYYADLPGPKWLRYTPNTDHSQAQNLLSIIPATLSWLSDVIDDKQSPQFSWSLEPDGSIRVQTVTRPKRVRLWQATNPKARDFRLETIGAAWTSTELQDTGNGVYIGDVSPPGQGWTAFTVELTYPGSTLIPTPLESDEIFTTDVRVTPADLPYKDTDCPGYPAIGPNTVGLYDPAGLTFELRNTHTAGDPDIMVTYAQAGAGWTPLAGDWDGDGRDGVGLFEPETRTFYLKNEIVPGGPDIAATYDQAPVGWTPLAGDWDGDGRDGVGLFDPDTRTFYLKNEIVPGGPDIAVTYDQAPVGWTPLAGDWDGDGRDTLGLYQPDASIFYLKNEPTVEGPIIAVPFGPAAAGWRPVVGLWD